MTDLHTNILILSTPRTGSNLLCECLTQAQNFGKVDGFFAGTGALLKDSFVNNAEEWLNDHSKDGVHVTKASLDYFDVVANNASPIAVDAFMKRFTHYIVLMRKDKASQAVSFFMARQSLRWHSKSPSEKPDPSYDYWRILWHLTFIEGLEHRAILFAKGTKKPVLNLYYEDIVRDLSLTCHQIGGWAEVPLGQTFEAQPTLQKQHNPLKKQYIDRFNEEWSKRYVSSQ